MSKNTLSEIDSALFKAGAFLLKLESKASELFTKEKALAPEAAASVIALFSAVEDFISLAAPAAGMGGLNFAADSAAYAAFLQVVSDARAFVSVVDSVLKEAQ